METGIHIRAQGSTEYLVLLAVVLVIALVVISLIGFYPGLSLDAKITQSQEYWSSATPIAIVEAGAKYDSGWPLTSPYLRLRNTGSAPLTITKIISDGGSVLTNYGVGGSTFLLSDAFYIGPGEEMTISEPGMAPGVPDRHIHVNTSSCGGEYICHPKSLCNTDGTGTLVIEGLGFEYIEYIGGSTITKRQIGAAPLIVKCSGKF